MNQVKDIVLDSNPALEAFGNAMTLRNNNSSRFGKYFQLRFTLANGGTPNGGVVTNYLLEKSRVVRPGPGERGFHVFYQLLAGADSHTRQALQLGRVSDYKVLGYSGVTEINNDGGKMDDLKEFQDTLHSMATLGISPAHQTEFFRIIATVLHMSNVEFVGANVDGADGCRVKDPKKLATVAQILQVDAHSLEYALTMRTLNTMAPGGKVETYKVPQNPAQAEAARDALCKDLYFRSFDALVQMVNVALNMAQKSTRLSMRQVSRGMGVFGVFNLFFFCFTYWKVLVNTGLYLY